MHKSDLARKVAERCELSDAAGALVVDAVFDIIRQALAAGEEVAIAKFGSFKVRERAGRQGRNPKTGETIAIAASKRVGFKAALALKEALGAK